MTANKKLTELPAGGTISSSDPFYSVQGSSSVRVPASAIRDHTLTTPVIIGASTATLIDNFPVTAQIVANGSNAWTFSAIGVGNNGSGAGIVFAKTLADDPGTGSALVQGNEVGSIWVAGSDGTATYTPSAGISWQVDGPVSAGVVPIATIFNTGSGGYGSEKLRISSRGILTAAPDGQSGTETSDFNYSSLIVNGDTKDVSGGNNETKALLVELITGSTSGAAGQKIALQGLAVGFSGGSMNTGGDIIGVQAAAISGQPNGGTNTGAGAKGTLYGFSAQGHAFNGAVNYSVVSGGEYDAIIDTGASAKHRWGISVTGNGSVRGAASDAALEIGAVSGAGSHNTGILLDSFHGAAPLSTSGVILGTDGTAFTVANGVDLSAITFSGAPYLAPLMSVATTTGTGTTGSILWSTAFIYVCVGTNSWRRAALSTW